MIDLGDEPALVTADNRQGPPDRRAVSLRWLTGTILTGFASAALMGGALYVALDGRHQFALPPQALAAVATGERPSSQSVGLKGDRRKAVVEPVSNRQVLQVSTVSRVGDKDFIKVRPFARIAAGLATSRTSRSSDIPAFNPANMFDERSGSGPVGQDEGMSADSIYDAEVEGEVLISTTDFPIGNPLVDADVELTTAEVEGVVRESARFLTAGTVHAAALAYVNPERFDFHTGDRIDLASLGVRIIPENVTEVKKSDEETVTPSNLEEKILTVRRGDSLRGLLVDNGATETEAEDAIQAIEAAYDPTRIREGQKLRLAYAQAEDDIDRARPVRISLYSEQTHEATIALADHGHFVLAEEPSVDELFADQFAETEEEEDLGPATRVYEGIYETALANDIPSPLIKDLVRIFSFDVDFQRRTASSDSMEVLYSMESEDSDQASEILYAAINVGGTLRKFYRFRSPDDGYVDYYDETGKSAKKFLLRKPVANGRFRSPFGARRHPILRYVKMHTGVDWAAPRGTPIMAAGNGTIVEAGWKSGYGKYIRIRHANGYETAYAHQSAFGRGMEKGARVRQGQIIGYVGSTGLSTGPHLHFEVLVNGRHVDPMRIRLPRGRVLSGEMLASFERERDRVDALMAKGTPSTRVATASAAIR
ncbi:MAG: M23 family metallopeptidase [Hyphomicrobiales bacterium]